MRPTRAIRTETARNIGITFLSMLKDKHGIETTKTALTTPAIWPGTRLHHFVLHLPPL